jgi:signal transduction histidine kinase
LGEAVEQATRLLEPVAREAGIELTCEVDRRAADLPYGAVFAVVVNAIRNAIEATQAAEVGDGGRRGVQVAAKVDGAWAQVTVTDWGAGIDGRLLDERGCFRFGATTKGPGRGLGLLLSRDIVQGLGGTLELSNGLSGGAVLTLRLAVKE